MLITNANVITWGENNQILNDHAVLIEGDRIAALGPSPDLEAAHPEAERLDAQGQYLLPGSICAHTHFYGAFARGMAIPGDPPKDFPEILERLWWTLDKALTLDDVRASAEIFMVDAIRHGTTTLIDHHASPNAIEGSLDVIAEAVDAAGLRACLCYEVTDRNGPQGMQAGIDENLRFIAACRAAPHPRLAATFGLHASLTLSDATLEACRAAHDGGFHIHVAEHEADEYDSLKKSNTRVVDRLQKFGILGRNTIAAHCVHIDYQEAGLLRETGTWVTHQPRSNMNNAVGAAEVDALLRAGVPVCLGTDGFSSAMWEEWKAAYFLHKVTSRDPRRAGGYNVAQMAVQNNAALANTFFTGAQVGVVAPGASADLILVDYHPTTPLSAGNLPWHIIFGWEASLVTTTICAGRVLMQNRKLLTVDEAEITAKSRELAARLWKRLSA